MDTNITKIEKDFIRRGNATGYDYLKTIIGDCYKEFSFGKQRAIKDFLRLQEDRRKMK
ncbi:hypothetical protein [Helicobacter pylori]|uniref:hypothetical protein n=1 Tax=Helicobacter pylori TaxID=210 RepID=UPI0012FE037A|nr:hypothetical protein [Helicobacter pylori]